MAKYNVPPVDTKWVDTDEALEGEPMLRSRIVAREFKSAERPDLYAGTPPPEALKAIISIAASPEFSLMHVDVSCAFHTRRPLRGGRIEGESVGAQEAAGERVSNQSEHHRSRFGKEHQGVEPQNTGERQGYCANMTIDTLIFSQFH